MGLIKSIKSKFGFKSNPQLIDTSEKLAQAVGVGYETITGQQITTTRAMQLTTVFGCVRVLSESIGMLPCKLYKEDGRNKITATSHKLYDLLYTAPNSYMTAQEHWELLTACLCLRGNYYAYKVKGLGNEVIELLPINPDRVKPKLNDDWTVEYQVTFKTGLQTLTQDEIWHVRLFTLDGLHGLNPIAYARQAIALALSTEEHGTRLFTNGAVTSGVLTTDQALTEPAFDRLKEQFNNEYTGMGNSYKPMILEMGLNWKPISLNAEDSQFLETRQYQKNEICGIFRVPPHLVGNMEKMTLNNMEQMGMSYVNYSLVPYLTRIESRARVGLLNSDDRKNHYIKFNAGALMRGDLKGRYESYTKGIQWGILSPNDCRELEDMNPRKGGDIYIMPLNMTANPEKSEDN